MKKRFQVSLTLPVVVDVVGEDRNGEIIIIDVCSVSLPSVADIDESLTDNALQAIDEAFAGGTPEV